MEFPNKPGSVAGFAENIADVHLVAFQCDIKTGKPLVLFAANRIVVKFAMRVTGKATG